MGNFPYINMICSLLRTQIQHHIPTQQTQAHLRLVKYVEDQIRKRLTKGEGQGSRQDYVHHLLAAPDIELHPETQVTELRQHLIVLVGAGTDTTSSGLAGILFYLSRYPRVLKKLTEEIRSAFASVEDIRNAKLNSLTYLRACIDETLRISPPAPGSLPREVLAGGIQIDGQYIPEGTQLGVPVYAIHHNDEYFSDAFTSKPERWIVDEEAGFTSEIVEKSRSAFCPFSLGSRACIGKGLVYMELSLTVARTLFLYDIKQPVIDKTGEGRPSLGLGRRRKSEYQLSDRLIGRGEGPILEFEARH
jgi:cytochrome P450